MENKKFEKMGKIQKKGGGDIVEKINISAIYTSIILIFFSESSFGIYLQI